ncbi:MAG: hypothetical protein QMD46_07945 [Methanomicrobiales archaeon]|nr:hypothetical protein [Methanomicrobiales archaeon]MDI6877335.1 hypothetical protein [Methanomicrobiales archaeon]
MAVNQAQVDHIISSASADDPEVKLLKLQEEVDLIKTSIKRLLIDIRERMNELENPFVVVPQGSPSEARNSAASREEAAAAREAAAAAREAAAALRESQVEGAGTDKAGPAGHRCGAASAPEDADCTSAGGEPLRAIDTQLLETLRSQLSAPKEIRDDHPKRGQERIRLQKVHRLFEWTRKTVTKYGHDRLEMMLDSYRAMGYITKEDREQVREIARLMPPSIGDQHEMGSDEFVQELYSLNRILDPNDNSLDRDMIEVLMEQKRRTAVSKTRDPVQDSEESWIPTKDRA